MFSLLTHGNYISSNVSQTFVFMEHLEMLLKYSRFGMRPENVHYT